MSDLNCPVCGAELDLATVFAGHVDQQVLERLINVGFPIGSYLLRYIALHKPPKQALTIRKKLKLIHELLPDVERQHINRNGRDWVAPKSNWALAIDQMVTAAHTGGLGLPLKGHGYLYAVLQSMADKAEGAAEAKSEADRRTSRAHQPTVTVRGQAISVGQALGAVAATKAALDQQDRTAAQPGPDTRAKIAELLGARFKKGQS